MIVQIAERIVDARHSELPDINKVVPSTLSWGMTNEELDVSEILFRYASYSAYTFRR